MITIEEYNELARAEDPRCRQSKIIREWLPSGLECPCGCGTELLQLNPQPLSKKQIRIKCFITEQKGRLLLDGTKKEIIIGVKWNKK